MNIVVIDAATLNPGDLSWDKIAGLGNIQFYDRSNESQIVERCKTADIILTNKVPFTEKTLQQLPQLKLIAVTATGYNIIDADAARKNNVVVCNVPDYGTDSVAQHTFALILELTNRVGLHSASVSNGDWVACPDFSYALSPLIELKDKVLGLVGFGSIGKKTAEIAKAFGMKIIYHTPSKKQTDLAEYRELTALFAESDFVSLHLPLNTGNKQFVNKSLLDLMKPSAFFINTARGQLVNEEDLANALDTNRIAGAAIDVLSVEPPSAKNPLLSASNCIITPHNAWMSKEARERIMEISFNNIEAFVAGQALNRVN